MYRLKLPHTLKVSDVTVPVTVEGSGALSLRSQFLEATFKNANFSYFHHNLLSNDTPLDAWSPCSLCNTVNFSAGALVYNFINVQIYIHTHTQTHTHTYTQTHTLSELGPFAFR